MKNHIPNILTLSRLIGAAVFIALLAMWRSGENDSLLLIGAGVFVIAVVTDALDGHLARKWNVVSMLGRVMDPLADKVIVLGGFVMLASPSFEADGRMISGVSSWMVVVIIARELLVTAIRSVMEARGIDFSASFSGKLKMILQSIAIPLALLFVWLHLQGEGGSWHMAANLGIAWAVVGVTVASGIPYITRAISAGKHIAG